MEEKHRYKALIEGRVYTIVGHRSREHMDAVVQLVTQQLKQLQELDPELSQQDRALLMAINAVSDQISKEERIIELEKQTNTLDQGKTHNRTK